LIAFDVGDIGLFSRDLQAAKPTNGIQRTEWTNQTQGEQGRATAKFKEKCLQPNPIGHKAIAPKLWQR
jgi:hypothetical protein